MPDIPADRVALVIGVTGHRDVAPRDEAPLRETFCTALRELSASCPHVPLVVLSGLATGADSLAAEEAMERSAPVIAVLPMPVDEYEKDFSSEELPRFRRLLEKCARVVVASPQRENGYFAAGAFLAQYSHVLVAFWDGDAGRGEGGTADVVRMRTKSLPSLDADVTEIPYLPDLGPVYHIVTPRSTGTPPPDAYALRRIFPQRFLHDTGMEREYETIVRHLDQYNLDLLQAHASDGASLHALVERTDAVANRLQKRTNAFRMLLLAFALLAAAVQIVGHLPSILKVAGLAAAFVAYRLARKNDYENRYQDYRALAEALRVQNAWYYAGERRELVDRSYLHMQEGELQWIRMALRYFHLVYCATSKYEDASPDHEVCRDWVRMQWQYYYRAGRREAACNRALNRTMAAGVGAGIVCLIAAAVALGVRGQLAQAFFPSSLAWPGWTTAILENLLSVPLALAAMLAAILADYANKQNLQGNARRYERMFRVFDRGRRDLLSIAREKRGNARHVLLSLGRAALVEHADWLIARRERPLQIVVV